MSGSGGTAPRTPGARPPASPPPAPPPAPPLGRELLAGKVVVVACMRKLLTILNAMVRDRLTWDQLDLVKLETIP